MYLCVIEYNEKYSSVFECVLQDLYVDYLLTISNDFYKLKSSSPYAVIEKRIIQKLWFLKIQ